MTVLYVPSLLDSSRVDTSASLVAGPAHAENFTVPATILPDQCLGQIYPRMSYFTQILQGTDAIQPCGLLPRVSDGGGSSCKVVAPETHVEPSRMPLATLCDLHHRSAFRVLSLTHREREREGEREREREREGRCVCVQLCERDSERKGGKECVRVCVCVRERERERVPGVDAVRDRRLVPSRLDGPSLLRRLRSTTSEM